MSRLHLKFSTGVTALNKSLLKFEVLKLVTTNYWRCLRCDSVDLVQVQVSTLRSVTFKNTLVVQPPYELIPTTSEAALLGHSNLPQVVLLILETVYRM
jgi:hypothetical protein